MKLNRIIQDYFTFTRGERAGLLVLVLIIGFLMIVNHTLFHFEEPTIAEQEAFERFVAEQRRLEETAGVKQKLFAFDPNTIDSVSLDSLLLSERIKRNLLSYRRSGGRIRKVADFRKLYGMNDSIYRVLSPYLLIQPVAPRTKTDSKEVHVAEKLDVEEIAREYVAKVPTTKQLIQIDLNQASAEELELLRGIGPVLSKRIVKYRDLLGGFIGIDQLKEVYGLKPEVVQDNLAYLLVDTSEVRKIDVNFLTVDELAAHPYIDYKTARRIVDFRSKNGYISAKNVLLDKSLVDAERYRKLEYYLK